MNEKIEWLQHYAQFQGRVQTRVAEDIVEHGKPHGERNEDYLDLKMRCVEQAALAFEMYVALCKAEAAAAAQLLESMWLESRRWRMTSCFWDWTPALPTTAGAWPCFSLRTGPR